MQIDLIITDLDVGGAERTMTRLATSLHQAGNDVRVFVMGRLPDETKGDGRNWLVRDLVEAGVDLTSGEATSSWDAARVARTLMKWVHRRPAAVRQSFLFHANVMSSFASWTLSDRRKGVDVAGIRVADPNSKRLWLERQAMRNTDHVVCVSKAVEAFARDRLAVPVDRTSVIGNSVDVDRFDQATAIDWGRLGWRSDVKVALFVGRLHPQKNLELLQQQIDQFAPLDSDRKLVLMGKGPLQDRLQTWADSVSGDRVRLLPWQADVAPWIKACRVLVLPSRYEGMPNVVMEAMAAGKPVVCSRVEGSSELIGEDSDQGFPPDDGRAMSDCLNRFLEDTDLASRVAANNQARMRLDFSVQRMVSQYHDLYERLLAERQ